MLLLRAFSVPRPKAVEIEGEGSAKGVQMRRWWKAEQVQIDYNRETSSMQ